MVQGKLSVLWRFTNLVSKGQGLLGLQKVQVGLFWTFFLLSIIPFSLSGSRPNID